MENNSQPYYMVFIIKTLPSSLEQFPLAKRLKSISQSINSPHFPSIYTALHSHWPREVGPRAFSVCLPQRRRQASAIFCSGIQIFGKITNKCERGRIRRSVHYRHSFYPSGGGRGRENGGFPHCFSWRKTWGWLTQKRLKNDFRKYEM